VAVNTMRIFSGNRRTPRRYGLTAEVSNRYTCDHYEVTVEHEVRLLSVNFGTNKVYHDEIVWSRIKPQITRNFPNLHNL
jgi:hypothetical protein